MDSTINMTLTEAALFYYDHGWSIVPANQGKAVTIRWKRYQTDRAAPERLRKWFDQGWPSLAVVLGDVSGGLVCRDFDDVASYEHWAAENSVLAEELPTVRTHDGYHVYAYTDQPEVRGRNFDDGEFRACGQYTILPPSIHPDGTTYTWYGNSDQKLANSTTISISDSGFLQSYTSSVTKTHDEDVTKTHKDTTKTHKDTTKTCEDIQRTFRGEEQLNLASLTSSQQLVIWATLQETLPGEPGQRNHCSWSLARRLRAFFGNIDPKLLLPLFKLWYQAGVKHMSGDHDFPFAFKDFCRQYKLVEKPGEGFMTRIVEMFVERGLHPVAEMLVDEDGMAPKALATICAYAQESAEIVGNDSFYLTARTAVELLKQCGVHGLTREAGDRAKTYPVWANRTLKVFVSMQILECLDPGSFAPRRPAQWRFIWTPADAAKTLDWLEL